MWPGVSTADGSLSSGKVVGAIITNIRHGIAPNQLMQRSGRPGERLIHNGSDRAWLLSFSDDRELFAVTTRRDISCNS